MSASLDGTLRLWSDDLPEDPVAFRTWLDHVTNARIGANSQLQYAP